MFFLFGASFGFCAPIPAPLRPTIRVSHTNLSKPLKTQPRAFKCNFLVLVLPTLVIKIKNDIDIRSTYLRFIYHVTGKWLSSYDVP